MVRMTSASLASVVRVLLVMLKQTTYMMLSLLLEALIPGGPCCWMLSLLETLAPGGPWMPLLLEALAAGSFCSRLLPCHKGCCRDS